MREREGGEKKRDESRFLREACVFVVQIRGRYICRFMIFSSESHFCLSVLHKCPSPGVS
jgi:hypothetical protein